MTATRIEDAMMKSIPFKALASLSLIVLLPACANFSPDGGFGAIEQSARQHLGKDLARADSPQAIAAAYYIGRTQKEIGRTREAKVALKNVVAKHPAHLVGVYAIHDLIDMATAENDTATKVELWKKLTFDIKRTRDSNGTCVQASQQLATHSFREGAFDDGVKALATTYNAAQMPSHVVAYVRTPLSELIGQEASKAKATFSATAFAARRRVTARCSSSAVTPTSISSTAAGSRSTSRASAPGPPRTGLRPRRAEQRDRRSSTGFPLRRGPSAPDAGAGESRDAARR